ncbi:hypothetical protein PR202_gb28326 [Eleusine coracana subsp. coracana]|uniref:KIB1-4 beta-propeller domain-containing protein n=1 Tax=Eleusine coracana subsp. coracana TaxID=191504 RepID=A0AAV5FW34_ELECO|nr:hypothetical protein PR202_gb28326 [Eleusine coracana subsp. coracana]
MDGLLMLMTGRSFNLSIQSRATRFALPSITTNDYVTAIYDENGAVQEYYSWAALQDESRVPPSVFGLRELRNYFFGKAFLSSDPSTGSYIVAVIHNTRYQISFARAGDDCWTRLPPHESFTDCVFKDDLLYALTKGGKIVAFNFSGPTVNQEVIIEKTRIYDAQRMYIVQEPSGDLLQIWGVMEDDDSQPELEPSEEKDYFSEPDEDFGPYPHHTLMYKVYRVDLTEKRLVEINGLGENAVFLGFNQSACLNVDEYPQLKANHIYFTDDGEYMAFGGKSERRSIGVVNLDNNTRQKIVSPQIWSNWPSPIWITPNPRKRLEGNREERMESGYTAVPKVSRCAQEENAAGGKTITSSFRKVLPVKMIDSSLFGLLAMFIFGLLGMIRSIGCMILKKTSLYRNG